jgi:hypothetical protein
VGLRLASAGEGRVEGQATSGPGVGAIVYSTRFPAFTQPLIPSGITKTFL